MSIMDRFTAAVNVIGNLPKNGPYQPSNEMKLSFYAYYKQATEGPNNEPKPWTWEVIKKAKWDSWKKLGDMTKEQAMTNYVEELNKIIETMSYNENVANFLKSTHDSLYNIKDSVDSLNVVEDDLSLISTSVGDETVKNLDNKSLHSNKETVKCEDEEEFFTPSLPNSVVYSDFPSQSNNASNNSSEQFINDSHNEQEATIDILMRTILTMRRELNDITAAVHKLEQKQKSLQRKNVFVKELSTQAFIFIIIWPLVSHFILTWLYNKRKLKY